MKRLFLSKYAIQELHQTGWYTEVERVDASRLDEFKDLVGDTYWVPEPFVEHPAIKQPMIGYDAVTIAGNDCNVYTHFKMPESISRLVVRVVGVSYERVVSDIYDVYIDYSYAIP